jgi:L-alanine-DL-glutamate epimerase-like enolase superfamily enzyme
VSSSFVEIQKFPIAGDGFTISRETKTDANVVYVRLTRNGLSGEGECVPLKRYGHTTESIWVEIENWLAGDHPWDREVLIKTLPAGPARFAIDTALWQLEAAEKNLSFAKYFGEEIHTLPTAFTLSGAAPEKMAAMAKLKSEFRWLKIKLMGDGLDAERLNQINDAVPEMELIVDANEALTPETLLGLLPVFQNNNVVLIEQPLPAGNDEALKHLKFPIPFAADESCHDLASLEHLVGKYQVINIKLDKSGGLTHAVTMKRRASSMGFKVMVGCMASTSLSILPAFFLAQGAAFIDLDGALLLQKDRDNSKLCYDSGYISVI